MLLSYETQMLTNRPCPYDRQFSECVEFQEYMLLTLKIGTLKFGVLMAVTLL